MYPVVTVCELQFSYCQ